MDCSILPHSANTLINKMTYSIVAYDSEENQIGVAVQSHSLCVGAVVFDILSALEERRFLSPRLPKRKVAE